MKKLLFALAGVALFIPLVASAAELRVNDEGGSEVIQKGETVKNVYSFGNNVVADADILGDFVGAGNYVSINGNVQFGVIAAGANVVINGKVNQNIRVAGGNVQINGEVGEDLLVAGGTVQVAPNSKVAGDIVATGGMVNLAGSVGGNINLSGGQVTVDGVVAGNIDAKDVDELKFGDNAVIHGNLKYSSSKEAVVSPKARLLGAVDYQKIKGLSKVPFIAGLVALATVGKLLSIIGLYILILLLTYLLSRFTKVAVGSGFSKPFAMFGWGFIPLIVMPIVAIVLLASLLGMQASVILGAVYFMLMLIARPLGSILLGTAIFKLFSKNKEKLRVDWLTGLVGLLVATILMIVPFVGWVIPFIFYAMALGVLVKWTWGWVQRNR